MVDAYPLLQEESDLIMRSVILGKTLGYMQIQIQFHDHKLVKVQEINQVPPNTLASIYDKK
jgi:hypothetical protein